MWFFKALGFNAKQILVLDMFLSDFASKKDLYELKMEILELKKLLQKQNNVEEILKNLYEIRRLL